jgi:hypothetical protein
MAFEKNPDDLGALWSKTGGKGEYLTGEVNGVKVVCFRNTSDNPKAPTWRVMKSKPAQNRVDGTAPTPVSDSDIGF